MKCTDRQILFDRMVKRFPFLPLAIIKITLCKRPDTVIWSKRLRESGTPFIYAGGPAAGKIQMIFHVFPAVAAICWAVKLPFRKCVGPKTDGWN